MDEARLVEIEAAVSFVQESGGDLAELCRELIAEVRRLRAVIREIEESIV